jgi:hypothetical protein
MRHALVRLWSMCGVEAKWLVSRTSRSPSQATIFALRGRSNLPLPFPGRLLPNSPADPARFVPEGHPTVFDITKRKIHNVLQGVAQPGVEISDVDKNWFELWIQQNCEYATSAVPVWPESRNEG